MHSRCRGDRINTGRLNGRKGTTQRLDDNNEKRGGGNYGDGFLSHPPPPGDAAIIAGIKSVFFPPGDSPSTTSSYSQLPRLLLHHRAHSSIHVFAPTTLFPSRAPHRSRCLTTRSHDAILDLCIVRNYEDYNDCRTVRVSERRSKTNDEGLPRLFKPPVGSVVQVNDNTS